MVLTVISFLIPNGFFMFYGNCKSRPARRIELGAKTKSDFTDIAMIGATVFILIGLVLLVDFAHSWSETCLERWEETDSPFWKWTLIGSTLGLYVVAFTLTGIQYAFFAGKGCTLNQFFITFNLILTLVVSALSVAPAIQEANPRSGLAQSGMVCAYTAYLVTSAIANHDDEGNGSCNPLQARAAGARKGMVVLGAVFTFLAIAYSTSRAATQSKALVGKGNRKSLNDGAYAQIGSVPSASHLEDGEMSIVNTQPKKKDSLRYQALQAAVAEGSLPASALDEDDSDDEGATGGDEHDDERTGTRYNYSFFHVIFIGASMYVAMLLTNWNVVSTTGHHDVPTGGGDDDAMPVRIGRSHVAMWMRIVSGWACLLLYTVKPRDAAANFSRPSATIDGLLSGKNMSVASPPLAYIRSTQDASWTAFSSPANSPGVSRAPSPSRSGRNRPATVDEHDRSAARDDSAAPSRSSSQAPLVSLAYLDSATADDQQRDRQDVDAKRSGSVSKDPSTHPRTRSSSNQEHERGSRMSVRAADKNHIVAEHMLQGTSNQTASTNAKRQRHAKTSQLVVAFAMISLVGMNDSATGANLESMKHFYDVSESKISLVFLANVAGYFVSSISTSFLVHHIGMVYSLWVACLVFAAGAATLGVAPPFGPFIAALVMLGFGGGLLDACLTTVVSHDEDQVLLAYQEPTDDMHNSTNELPLHPIASHGSAPAIIRARNTQTLSVYTRFARVLRMPIAWVGGVLIIIAFGSLDCLSAWLVSYQTKVRGSPAAASRYQLSGLWAGIAIGRALLAYALGGRLGERSFAIVLLTVAALALGLCYAVKQFIATAVLFVIAGMFMGPVTPRVLSTVGDRVPPSLKVTAMSLMIAFGLGGSAIAPLFFGFAVDKGYLTTLPAVLIVSCAVAAAFWSIVPRNRRRED
ncbi:Membrane protein tms1 [Microbotryomycetes sp. JL201]|nr:Membrane protein tms1 [Microbotryomycetes sp. JL201]